MQPGREYVEYDAYGKPSHRYAADVDRNGVVNAADQSLLTPLLGKLIDQSGYNADYDLDRNGVINAADQTVIGNMIGRVAAPSGSSSDSYIPNGTGTGMALVPGPDSTVAYSGYINHPRSAMLLARHRWYQPSLGRWMTRDPAGYVDGFNLYAYVGNNPLGYFDPSGLLRDEDYRQEARLARAAAGQAATPPVPAISNIPIRQAVESLEAYQGEVMELARSGQISHERAVDMIRDSSERALVEIDTHRKITNSIGNRSMTVRKVMVNGSADTVGSLISLGFWDPPDVIAVNDYNRAANYSAAKFALRLSQEAAGGMATGALSKVGKLWKAFVVWDIAGNGVSVGKGAHEAWECGLTTSSILQMLSGAAGLGGDLIGSWRRAAVEQAQHYRLVAARDGAYPVMKRGFKKPVGSVDMKAGETWKFGETINPTKRYSQKFLRDNNLIMERVAGGTQAEMKIAEKMSLEKYLEANGILPPGNKIKR